MGLFDFVDSIFDPLSGSDAGNILGSVASGFMGGLGSSLNLGTPTSYPVYQPAYPMGGVETMPVPVANKSVAPRSAPGVPGWAWKYPNLWQFISKNALGGGAIGTMLSLLTRWGPTALTALWGAAVVGELISYKTTHKRRRMNPANAKALRRSLRRLKSFENLSCRVTSQLSRACKPRRRKCA